MGGRKTGKDNEVEHLELVSATEKAAMEGHGWSHNNGFWYVLTGFMRFK